MRTQPVYRPEYHRYRRCSVCGREWNVSKAVPSSRRYICPNCELKAYLEEQDRKRRAALCATENATQSAGKERSAG